MVDLLTIAGLRESLAEFNSAQGQNPPEEATASAEEALIFVESIFDTFRWVVVAVVGFYFAAGAAEAISANAEKSAESRAKAEVEVARIQHGAAATPGDSVEV